MGLQLTWVPGLWLSGHVGSTRIMRFSAGMALSASAVERKLSSPASFRPFFLGPSGCTEDFRFGAMAVLGHRGALRPSWPLHPTQCQAPALDLPFGGLPSACTVPISSPGQNPALCISNMPLPPVRSAVSGPAQSAHSG
jgi:hypothetical protein